MVWCGGVWRVHGVCSVVCGIVLCCVCVCVCECMLEQVLSCSKFLYEAKLIKHHKTADNQENMFRFL